MPGKPLVSILINNYNYASLLGEAIESALGQTYPHVEVVVVDDGSTDGSQGVIEQYGERVVPVLKANGGQCSAVNAGFTASRGEIVCLLDSDDVFFPSKVERVVAIFEQHPDVAWVKNNLSVTDGALRPLGVSVPNTHGSRLLRPKSRACLEDKTRFVLTSGLSLRRAAAASYLPISATNLAEWRYSVDAYIGFWAAATGSCYELAEPLGYYRRQDHQRLLTDEDLVLWLERQNLLEERFARMWSAHTGRAQIGSDVYKHQMIVDSLRGTPRWSAARGRNLVRGIAQLAKVAGAEPQLAARQAAALCFAFGAPRAWVDRMRRSMALAQSQTPAVAGDGTRSVPTNSLHDFS
jgi:glycosyltransferase involved in cell wall biosynthesis